MTTAARVQYNGMLLLASYVQRLHVFYATLQHVENKTYPEIDEAKDMFESLNLMMPMFESTKTLTISQFDKITEITEKTTDMMKQYFQPLNTSFGYKTALVASTLFGEQLMNNGVIRLGKLFNEEISSDFEKRVKFYDERTRLLQIVVTLLKDGKMPDETIVKIVENFFEGIIVKKDVVLGDLQNVTPMIKVSFS